VFCTKCGHPNREGARFCASCGEPLQEDTTVSLSPVEVEDEGAEDLAQLTRDLAAGQALLAVRRGPNAGTTFLIEPDADVVTIGRNPDNDLFLDDVTVSRRHAEIRRRGDGFSIHDLGSLNGTYVNRERVEETVLAAGDELQIGKFRLVFVPGET
jgi:pSer/pThr/pTyr-binding forkhead associated (FHA) protein